MAWNEIKDKQRLLLGSLFFALMFFYIGVQAYFVFIHVGSYDGWHGVQKKPGAPAYITGTDPEGPATALRAGDEFLAINGITPAQDPTIMAYSERMSPGTTYVMSVRRGDQRMDVPITTVAKAPRPDDLPKRIFVLIYYVFLLTGLTVFLLKPDNRQAWLLALMLGTFVTINAWNLPFAILGRWVEYVIAFTKILGLWFLPLFVRFFLNFPERSPILRRWPKVEKYLNWPLYLFVLPYIGAGRLPPSLTIWYFNLPAIKWLDAHSFFSLSLPIIVAYLAAGLICLAVNYRAADRDARRRLRVVMFGSGAGFLNLLLAVSAETTGLQERVPGIGKWLELSLLVTLPFIPLSFAYAIIRHKVIPVSLIIKRSARYVFVSRGSAVLLIAGVGVLVFFAVDAFFYYVNPMSGRVIGIISGVLAIIIWNLTYSFHQRVIAPLVDRHFFRESYDARAILAELSQAVRSATSSRQLLELVCAKIQQALHVENVTVLLRDDEEAGDYMRAMSFDYRENANQRDLSPQNDVRLPADLRDGDERRLSRNVQ